MDEDRRASQDPNHEPFHFEEWLTQGLRGMLQAAGVRPLPPEFWQHLGAAVRELGQALQVLSDHLRDDVLNPPVLREYEEVMRRRTGGSSQVKGETDGRGNHPDRG